MEQAVLEPNGTYPGVLLTIPNAARLAGVVEGTLWECVAKGELCAQRGRRGGDEVWLVPLHDLKRRFASMSVRPRQDQLADEAVRRVEADFLERLASIERSLDASERVERGAQRYADRVEHHLLSMQDELAGERHKALLLARTVGQLEGERDRLLRKLEAIQAPPIPLLDGPGTTAGRSAGRGRSRPEGWLRRLFGRRRTVRA